MLVFEIPTLLKQFTRQESVIAMPISANVTLLKAIQQLVKMHPSIGAYLLTDDNQLTSFVSFYINGKNFRTLAGENSLLTHSDRINIVAAIAGG